ncbi:MAG: hypothetical protein Q6361_01020 [Candidatus Hermodarchaeota archaeon]|nr:hypothetical protein [Candidatus Hermodarchaeota archaeon]
MKLKVRCPQCGTTGELEVPDGAFEKVEGNIITGRVKPGKICEHGFVVEFSQAGLVLGYYGADAKPEDLQVRPVRFTVQSITRNLGTEVVAAMLTAGISEVTVILIGSLPVTMGVRDFMERVLPDSVDVGSSLYMVTLEEYTSLPASTKQYMTVNIAMKEISNPAFDDEQLAWMRKVLIRASMVTNKDAAETLILKEASKLRTTVSLLRHLAARRSVTHEEPKKQEDTN